jgi:hypothetical protein
MLLVHGRVRIHDDEVANTSQAPHATKYLRGWHRNNMKQR